MNKQLAHHLTIFSIIFIVTIAILLDSIGSSETLNNLLGFSSSTVLIIGWLSLGLISKMQWKELFDSRLAYFLVFLTTFTFITSTIISLWDYQTPVNYVFSITRIQQHQLAILPLFYFGAFLIARPKSWWRVYHKWVIFLSPIIGLIYLLMVRIWPMAYFLEIVKENHFIENLQFLILIFGAGYIAFHLVKHRQIYSAWQKFILVFFIIGLIFVAGDEIAWGQQFLGIETPEKISKINRQNEITIHNIPKIQAVTETGYILIGLVGAFSWIIPAIIPKIPKNISIFMPSKFLFFYFIIPAIYFMYPYYSVENLIKEWSEVMELLLYFGIVFHLSYISTQLTNKHIHS